MRSWLTVALVGLQLVAPPADAQRRADASEVIETREQAAELLRARSRRGARVLRRAGGDYGPSEARAVFDGIVYAAVELSALEVTPGDANGQVRRWDERFGRMVALSRLQAPAARASRHDCSAPEVNALTALGELADARSDLYVPGNEDRRHDFLIELVRRRLVADEAARRRAAGLSCEDLPTIFEVDVGIPELFHLTSLTRRSDDRWPLHLVVLNVTLLGPQTMPLLREQRTAERVSMFERIRGALSGRAPGATLSTIPLADAPTCGDQVRLSEDEAARWTAIGIAADRTWFAYGLTVSADGVVIRARGDADCDGQVERYEARMLRSDDGGLLAASRHRE